MPVYEFQCSQCRKRFSEQRTFEQFEQHKPVKCPKCGSRQVSQVLSPAFAKTSKKS